MQLSFVFHILGTLFWLGGLIVLSRILRVFVTSATESGGTLRTDLIAACRTIYRGFILSGFLIVVLSGLYQLISVGVGFYMKQGWFHGKLTLILIIIGITVYCGMQIAKISRGETLTRKSLAIIHGGTAGSTLLILLLTYLGR